MSKTWKWILGTLGVVLIVGVATAAIFVWANHSGFSVAYRLNRTLPNSQTAPGTPNAPSGPDSQQNPNLPFGFRQYRGDPYYGFERRMPMMGGRGFGGLMPFGFGFFFLGGLLRLLLPAVILILVAVLFYQLGKHAGRTAAPATPSTPPSAPTQLPSPPPGRKVAKN